MKTFNTTINLFCWAGKKTICIAWDSMLQVIYFFNLWLSCTIHFHWCTWHIQQVPYCNMVHPCSRLHTLLHLSVHPALIQPLISTLIPVLFQEHRDCLMIYWPNLSICTVNHNGPSTKEEPVGHTLVSWVMPSHLPCNQSRSSLLPCVTSPRLGPNVL